MSGNKFPVPLPNLPDVLINSISIVLKEFQHYETICEQEKTKRYAISKQAEIEIEKIRQQALLLHKLIDKTYEERKYILENIIKTLDHGIQTSNIETISMALNSLCYFVKETPIKMLTDISKITSKDRNEIIEI